MNGTINENGSKDIMGIIPPIIPAYRDKHPQWIGHKFAPDGTLLPFPGHSIIAHLPTSSPMHSALQKLCQEIKQQDFGSSIVLLPPSTYHMTIYEGVSDKLRQKSCWPKELALDRSLAECTQFVAKKLHGFDVEEATSFRLSVVGWWPPEDGFAVKLVGANAVEEQKLRRLRDRLAEHIGIRHPNFDEYSFHIGTSYQLRLNDKQTSRQIEDFLQDALKRLPQEVEFGLPEFCTYDNMMSFHRQFFLTNGQSADGE